jgi:hypothetical protein
MEKRHGRDTKEINRHIDDRLSERNFLMFLPGLVVRKVSYLLNIRNGTPNQFEITAQHLFRKTTLRNWKRVSKNVWEHDMSRPYAGFGVNGYWWLSLVPRKGSRASDTLLVDWTIHVKETDVMTMIRSYGTVKTIVGDGSWKKDKTRKSQSGQLATRSMGGRSWGVCLNPQGTIFYNSFDQGFVAYITKNNRIKHVVENLKRPMVMDFSQANVLYVADYGNNRIMTIPFKGLRPGRSRPLLDRGQLKQPMACRFGNICPYKLYIADTGHHRILEYHTKLKRLRVVAGTGKQGFSGDGGNRLKAKLNYPIDIDVSSNEVLIIADSMNNRLRAANLTDEIKLFGGVALMPNEIRTFAGSGPPNNLKAKSPFDVKPNRRFNFDTNEDGLRATKANIQWPYSPRVDLGGRRIIKKADNHRLRVIESCGLIYTVGGVTKEVGFRHIGAPDGKKIGDGGSPLQADFNRVMDIELIPKGRGRLDILLGDTDNNRLRLIENIELRWSRRPHDRYTDLEIIQLRNGRILLEGRGRDRKQMLGFESQIKNFGNANAPGELAGCLGVLYALYEARTGKPVACGTKTPVFLTTNHLTKDDSFCDTHYRFPGTAKITSSLPGAIDTYPPSTNAQTDVSKVPDGVYLYTQHIDPNGYYTYQNRIPPPKTIAIRLKTVRKGRKRARRVCRLAH